MFLSYIQCVPKFVKSPKTCVKRYLSKVQQNVSLDFLKDCQKSNKIQCVPKDSSDKTSYALKFVEKVHHGVLETIHIHKNIHIKDHL